MSDPFDLTRFKAAQNGVFETALAELKVGRKRSHWMWFVFPQLRGLGHSPTAQLYGIISLEEASAYLADPILSDRLHLAAEALLTVKGATAHDILGSPDDVKLRSSLTLFDEASGRKPGSVFDRALLRFFAGERDPATLELLASRR